MRSSIACARCRRSKIKCINAGVNTTCRACETAGRECTYPAPQPPSQASAKRDAAAAIGAGGHREVPAKRSRPRKSLGTNSVATTNESPRALEEALDSSLLTPKVWNDLFDIFSLHFSTDLPFLHAPTFLQPLRMAAMPQSVGTYNHEQHSPSPQLPASPMLLLGVLTLTARFHTQLVTYHSPPTPTRPSNPLVASEYYASALKSQFVTQHELIGQPSLDRIQALLMLGLHEWGMCRGVTAWIHVGIATRMSQAMGLQFERNLDDEPEALSSALRSEAAHLGVNADRRGSRSEKLATDNTFINQEIRRRTFWSCFLLDRYLSSGKFRPQMINVHDLRIQLPSSDKAFLFGEQVETRTLSEELEDASMTANSEIHPPTRRARHENGQDNGEAGRVEAGADEGVLSRVVKIVEIWGRIAKWSCSGGRRTDHHAPWDHRSTFYMLRKLLSQFHDSLPRSLMFSHVNTSAYIASKLPTSYTLMHTVYFLCLILLHREYVPFIPLRVSKPEGPLDPPLLDPNDVPEGFWEQSARECFKASSDMMDLVKNCQEWGVLVETPIIGFAIYTASFNGIYCTSFPYMDPEGYMSSAPRENRDTLSPNHRYRDTSEDGRGAEQARRALEILAHMRPRLKMADGWCRTIRRMHSYFSKMKRDYTRNTRALASSSESEGSPTTNRHLSLREGGLGGGLQEYKLLEKILKEFGSLEDDEPDTTHFSADKRPLLDDMNASDAGSAVVKSEATDSADGPPQIDTSAATSRSDGSNSFSAINVEHQHRPVGISTLPSQQQNAQPQQQQQQQQQAIYQPSTNFSTYHSQQYYNQQQPVANSTTSPNPPSLTSPTTQLTTTPLNSPFPRPDGGSQGHYQTYPHHPPYGHEPPPAQPRHNSFPHPTYQQAHDPSSAAGGMHPPAANPGWNAEAKETWLHNLPTGMPALDVVSFMDGSSLGAGGAFQATDPSWAAVYGGDGNYGGTGGAL